MIKLSLLIDVDLNHFGRLLAADPGFYWIETTKAFLMIKTLGSNEVARTAFMKTDSDQVETFKLRWLVRQGAVQVMGFYLDGVNVIDLAPKPVAEVASDDAIRENEEGVVE